MTYEKLKARVAELEKKIGDFRGVAVTAQQQSRNLWESSERMKKRIAELERALEGAARRAEKAEAQRDDACRLAENAARGRKELAERIAELEGALEDGLRSMDCRWEEDNLGHDWADWCERARKALKEPSHD